MERMSFDLYSGGNYRAEPGFRGDHEGSFPTIEAAMARAAEIGDDEFTIYEGDRSVRCGIGRYLRGPGGEPIGRWLEWTP
jgi:hypothetical protein